MNIEYFDDETLMAFADGELDEATSLRVEAALDHDEALAARLAVFLDTRLAVASAVKPLIDEPVPEALADSVRRVVQEAEAAKVATGEKNVLAFPGRETRQQVERRQWLLPIAASILAVITGVGGFVAGRSGLQPGNSLDTALFAALDAQPSGSEVALTDTQTLHIVATFTDGRGELCREYDLRRAQENTTTVACRANGAWVTRLALTSPRTEGYVPASSQDMVDAYLTTIEAGEPLAADAEKSALAKAE